MESCEAPDVLVSEVSLAPPQPQSARRRTTNASPGVAKGSANGPETFSGVWIFPIPTPSISLCDFVAVA